MSDLAFKEVSMTRKKVKLMWIVNDSARKASFKKRRVGLLKKVSELTTLCGVNAFVVIYGPDNEEPAAWPSRQVVQQLLTRFQGVPEMERHKKMMNQETYLRERATKTQEQLRKQQRKNKEMEMGHLMHQVDQGKGLAELELFEMTGLAWMLEEKIKENRKRMDYFQQVSGAPGSMPPPPPDSDDTGRAGGSTGADQGSAPTESYMWEPWFVEMIRQHEKKVAASNSSVRSDMGLPPNSYIGGPSNASDMGPIPYGNYGGTGGGIEMGLPYGNFIGASSTGGSEMGVLPYGNYGVNSGVNVNDHMELPHGNYGATGGGNNMGMGFPYHGNMRGGAVRGDMGVGMMPHGGNIGSGGGVSDMGLPGYYGGGSTGPGSDAGLPYDVTKSWQQRSITGPGSDAGLPYDVTKPWQAHFFNP